MGVSIQPQRSHRAQSLGLDPLARGRILLTTSNFPRWAGDSTTPFVLHLAQDLQALGWRVDVLSPHAPGAAFHEQLDGVSVERFRYSWPDRFQTVCYQGGALINLRKNRANFAKLPLLVLAEWAAIARRLARGRYDLLNSHWILPQGFTGVLAAKPFGVPHVITVHGGDVFALRHPLLMRTKSFALRHADAVTVNSTATGKSVEQIAPGLANLKRIPMGVGERVPDTGRVDQLRRTYRRGDGPLIVFLGRLVEEKGVADVIRTVSILVNTHPDTTALIVGGGQDRAELEQLSRRLDLEDRITFIGWVDPHQVADYLAAGDVFVGPSRRSVEGWVEAQGLTFAEAMLARTPVVATAIGGIPDTVRHEETGLLVDEASPHQIANTITRLIENPGFSQQLIDEAHRFARSNLTRQSSAGRFSDLFLQVCGEN
jgi:glycosyltransferase involved in cell wall biosynthesis